MKIKFLTALTLLLCLSTKTISAQGLADGFFNKKGKTNIALSYTYGTFDKFYLGSTEVDAVPAHENIDQTIYNLYVNYGLTDNITVIANVPYIKAEGFGAPDPVNNETEQSGVQDVSFLVKWSPFKRITETGSVTYIAALGGSIASGYEPNGILSIGNGASSIDAKLGLHFQRNNGFFGTVFVGYNLKGKADNNLNVGNGDSFDAPNSLNTQIKLGYCFKYFYIDTWFDAQKTNGNIDIGGTGFFGNFPETAVNYSRVGLNMYAPITGNIGVSVGGGTVVNGRNVGKTTFYSGGLVLSL